MSFQDRHYYGGGGPPGGGDPMQRLLAFLNRSFGLGTYLGIRVRVHITFLILFGIFLITDRDPLWTVQWIGVLFASVLLHEFGHCLGCRAVGGEADDILMWPLGGLAFCRPPQQPWPEFVTVACGPLVNLVLAVGGWVALFLWVGGRAPISLWPASFGHELVPLTGAQWFVAFIVLVNWALLLFNLLLVFYPFDGGRLVQIAIWTRVGYTKSLYIACSIGLFGGILVAMIGLLLFQNMMIAVIGGFGAYTCFQQKRALAVMAAHGMNPDIYAAARPAAPPRPSAGQKRAEKRRRAAAERARADQEEIDRILDKVHREGLGSLSAREKGVLRKASER